MSYSLYFINKIIYKLVEKTKSREIYQILFFKFFFYLNVNLF